jgi:hypothetical protein
MKISIEFDSDASPIVANIVVDGRKLSRVQRLELSLDADGEGKLLLSRLMPGYGNKFPVRKDIRLESKGGKWTLA